MITSIPDSINGLLQEHSSDYSICAVCEYACEKETPGTCPAFNSNTATFFEVD
jgi:rubrerythrin